ncbi:MULTISPECIES: helix-turn-helix domain-containing protein [unclassified Anabaena]|uniref:helix-turn-helix domain-containing protein n=1 Tax=unclassified Anabaena TaxID=2619674 RepID=UPI00083215BA|nr:MULTISPECIES: helix-turn-helix transcriptional regulator [unclassified Anabaena]
MNIESRQKLVEIIKLARGSLSQRAFGKMLGVSATAVQMWEKGVKVPDTENLAQIAAKAGYTMEELLCCLEGKPVAEKSDLNFILRQIKYMPESQLALVVHAVADRLATLTDASDDQAKAS